MSRPKPKRTRSIDPVQPLSNRKLWYFRLVALIGVPLILFGVVELGLRLAGFGYPTAFLLKSSNRNEKTFVQNNQFGWRFFGPRAARIPSPVSIPREKPHGTIRIFVFGESAAFGDPQPRFGLPRMLQAVLELRHPDQKFEVVNAAMTAINSHVIRLMARDCAQARADVWVIYMGNNEVVGPFGPGTVFGSQTAPRWLIRAVFAAKATRIGQAIGRVIELVKKTAGSDAWEGLRAFTQYKLAASDPRLRGVYRNFEQNLSEIIAAGRKSGAKIILCTVAVDLRDCAPFASMHRPTLTVDELNEWERFYAAGVKNQVEENYRKALDQFEAAARIDDQFAELLFRYAQCLLALNDAPKAHKAFVAARDLDALRFRCDSKLNEIIRRYAVGGVVLVDAERAFAEASPDGIPGAELFLEHVHLTLQGNYLLAGLIAKKVEELFALPRSSHWPSISECAMRLGYTSRSAQLIISDIRGRLLDVPFTYQLNHEDQIRRLTELARSLPPPNSPAALGEAIAVVQAALERWPSDPVLWEQFAELKQAEGDLPGALAAAQRALELLPSSAGLWELQGILLAQQAKFEEAIGSFKRALSLDPQAVWDRYNLALCLRKLGRSEAALVEFRRALRLNPRHGTGWLALGQLYEEMGRTNDAVECFSRALTNRVNQPGDMANLARFCFSKGWLEAAVTNFMAAVELAPTDPELRLEAGRALAAAGRLEDAAEQYRMAVELDPTRAQAHMQLGVTLGRLGQHALAEQQFRRVLQIDPNLLEARVNLGVALYRQGKFDDALKQFEEVLRHNPTDPTALRFVQEMQKRTSLPADR